MDDWGAKLEARIHALEQSADPETDEMIRKAFRTWLAFGAGMKWIIYLLAAIAGVFTAYEQIAGGVKSWWNG